MLLLHPGVGDSGVWDPQWTTFADRFRLLRCDLPGFGRSPLDGPRVSLAGSAAGLLDELGLRDAGIVGCSLGARVALELALARPELVRALVLVGALLPGERSEALRRSNADEEAALERGDLDAATECNLAMWLAAGVEPGVREAVRRMQRRAFELQVPWGDEFTEEPLAPDFADRLDEVRVPTLIVTGDEDVEDVQESAARLAAAITGAERAVVEGAAHVPSLERPQAFDAVVLPFLARALV